MLCSVLSMPSCEPVGSDGFAACRQRGVLGGHFETQRGRGAQLYAIAVVPAQELIVCGGRSAQAHRLALLGRLAAGAVEGTASCRLGHEVELIGRFYRLRLCGVGRVEGLVFGVLILEHGHQAHVLGGHFETQRGRGAGELCAVLQPVLEDVVRAGRGASRHRGILAVLSPAAHRRRLCRLGRHREPVHGFRLWRVCRVEVIGLCEGRQRRQQADDHV